MFKIKNTTFSTALFVSASLISLLLISLSITMFKIALIEPDKSNFDSNLQNNLTPISADPLITIAPVSNQQ